MKNIHILPTDKPSRLYKNINHKLCYTDIIFTQGGFNTNQNIYITSDEEIKEGDWYFNITLRLIQKSIDKDYLKGFYESCKKVILTTDLDLIKDGVQSIDNDFLEWFVKNPSCEKVEVKKGLMKLNDDGEEYGFPDMSLYKIIIPKEEFNYNMKQETLEEATERAVKSGLFKDKTLFIAGAKWQQERSYSEEEVRKISLDFFYHWWNSKGTNTEEGFDKWFRQFKKK